LSQALTADDQDSLNFVFSHNDGLLVGQTIQGIKDRKLVHALIIAVLQRVEGQNASIYFWLTHTLKQHWALLLKN